MKFALSNKLKLKHVFFIITIWACFQGYLSHNRSIWIDEWLHFKQIYWPVKVALQSLFEEISPFAPGQLMLGRIFYAITGGFPSDEFSGRLSSILFGSMTVFLAFVSRTRFLPIAIMFSVAMTVTTTQSRPYSAMVFCGAMAWHLIWSGQAPKARWEKFFVWFGLIFGQIYGICYLAMACFFRRMWKETVFAAAWLAVILYAHVWPGGKLSPFENPPFPPLTSIIKQTLGAISNPYKMSVIFSAFGLLMLWSLVRNKDWRRLVETACYFFATLVCPMLANIASGYNFGSRQMLGATFGFMALAAAGLDVAVDGIKRKSRSASYAVVAIYLAASMVPWFLFYNGIPPFIDQPLSRFKQAIQLAKDIGAKNVLWADSGTRMSIDKYGPQVLGEERVGPTNVKLGPFEAERTCWPKQNICFYAMAGEVDFTHNHQYMVNHSPEFKAVLNGSNPKFDLLVHSAYNLVVETNAKTVRTF